MTRVYNKSDPEENVNKQKIKKSIIPYVILIV